MRYLPWLRASGGVGPPAGALAGIRVLGRHRRHQAVEARLAGELRVERGRDDVALADGDDPAVVERGHARRRPARRARSPARG